MPDTDSGTQYIVTTYLMIECIKDALLTYTVKKPGKDLEKHKNQS